MRAKDKTKNTNKNKQEQQKTARSNFFFLKQRKYLHSITYGV